ncbi:hypothetical protein [Thiothrix unzii]|jgi:hypothetical protein|uniref:hypothetical protein n=1 Tax=Thiothrix unzii TaxID=111769 RepID=UPI002A367A5D|nr:hypothetical protein [Thiothrix unzii]MDX9989365.1 hypothetical protein [Thiothrix unzii]
MKNKYQDILSHLSKDQIDELMSRYYKGEKNDVLIEEYNINIKSVLLVKTFPVIIHENRLCPYCSTPLFSYRTGKNSSSSTIPEQYCQTCDHEDVYICNCSKCKEKREEKKINKIKSEEEILLNKYCDVQPIPYQNISFTDSLFILTLLLPDSELRCINNYKEENILPHQQNTEKAILKMIDNKILTFNKDDLINNNQLINNHKDVCYLSSEEKINFILFNSKLEINITRNGQNKTDNSELKLLLKTDLLLSDINYNKEDILESFLNLSTFEAISYLYDKDFFFKIEEHQIKNLRDSIRVLLKTYTLSETKGIVNTCYKDYQKNNLPYKKNVFIKNIREFDKKMKNYDRLSWQPRCLFSMIFCLLILKTEHDYFQENVFEFFEQYYSR